MASTDTDQSFDRYARMVRRTLGVPVAVVRFVGQDEPAEPLADHAPLVVDDAGQDDRPHDHPAAEGVDVGAYARWPLTDQEGTVIGSLCAIDDVPHAWTAAELETLADLAAACSAEIAQRGLRRVATQRARRARDASGHVQVLLALSEALADTRTVVDVAAALERVAMQELGCARAGIWLRTVDDPAPTGRPSEPSWADDPEHLTFVPHPRTDWAQALRFSRLGADGSNPLGEALVTGAPAYLPDVATQNARYPHLVSRDQVGEARAFSPLAVGGQAYGALALVWPEARTFSEIDRVAVVVLASYTAQAIQRALLLQERVDVSLVLQNSMLTRLPQPPGLRLAARYRPAGVRDRVGGDWYDAVVLPDGRTHLDIGDVVGHDMSAAAVMGQLRNMLRAFAWLADASPAFHVRQLDEAIRDLGLSTFATLLHARVEPADHGWTLRWSSAGHLAPMIVESDGRVEELDDGSSSDLMLGVDADCPRHDRSHQVRPGSTLLLFTDGLVENRVDSLTDGLARAERALAAHHRLPLERFLDAVISDLVPDHPEDDVAMLAVRFGPDPPGSDGDG